MNKVQLRFTVVGLTLSCALYSADAATFQQLPFVPKYGNSPWGGRVNGSHPLFYVSADGLTVVGPGEFGSERLSAVRWTNDGGTQSLGLLPGSHRTNAHAVSGDGSVVIGTAEFGRSNARDRINHHLVRWTADNGLEDLGVLANDSPTGLVVVNGVITVLDFTLDGSAAVGIVNSHAPAGGDIPFYWQQQMGITKLADAGEANALSSDGRVVIGGDSGGRFRWSMDSGLERLPLDLDDMADVSGDGMIVVGRDNDLAVRWTEAGGVEQLPLPDGHTGSHALVVTPDGMTIVGVTGGPDGGDLFRWTRETGTVVLETPDGEWLWKFWRPQAPLVSYDGNTIAATALHPTAWDVMIWRNGHDMQLLTDVLTTEYGLGENLAGWSRLFVESMSADGTTLVGTGERYGESAVWMAVIPEPDCSLLLGLGILGCFGTRNKRCNYV